MKRLIAAGAPSIVRIGPVFRAEESVRLHNPEFTMIEWYRLGFDLAAVDRRRGRRWSIWCSEKADYRHVTYRQLLHEGAGVDPFARRSQRRSARRVGTNATWSCRRMPRSVVATYSICW